MLNMNEERKLKLNPNNLNCTQESARFFKCGDSEDVSPESSPFALIAKDKNYYIKVWLPANCIPCFNPFLVNNRLW